MKTKKKRVVVLFLMILSFSVFLSGCAMTHDEMAAVVLHEFGITVMSRTVTITARGGTRMLAYEWTSGELTIANKNELRNRVLREYPNAHFVSEATTKFNCHSLAWWNQSTYTNIIWIDFNDAFLRDPASTFIASSTQTTTPQGVSSGHKVHYHGDNHSGIVFSSTEVTSKWGNGPILHHRIWDCPYDNTWRIDYYSY
jgi:hypothetical protein